MRDKINAYKILAGNVEGKGLLVKLEAARINFLKPSRNYVYRSVSPSQCVYAFVLILTAKKLYFPAQLYLNGILIDTDYILCETRSKLLYRKQNIFRLQSVRTYLNETGCVCAD
jgi:hypothetical protein